MSDCGNHPDCLKDLAGDRRAVLIDWMKEVLAPAQSIFARTSYVMKHDFEREPEGFYVTNGMFKGAMLAAGFRPADASEVNWRFRVKPARELDRWEKKSGRNLAQLAYA